MGQTLTHGVYLPDEGERNCYDGLASNWQLLDGAVGTVAEHTTQIAGKAPLVHTHGKADITDLFNSANTWTGDNTYTASIIYQSNHALGNLPQSVDSQTVLKINDSAGTNYLAQIATYQSTDSTGLRIAIRDKFDSNGFSPSGSNRNKYFNFLQNAANQSYIQWDGYANNSIVPLVNNTYELGTSTNKWKSLNGINPGALSLPDYTLANVDPIDFSQWNVSGGTNNNYVPASDGWLFVSIKDAATNSLFIYAHGLFNNNDNSKSTDYSASCFGNGSQGISGRLGVMIPVRAGITYKIIIRAASVSEIWAARFYPALGNV